MKQMSVTFGSGLPMIQTIERNLAANVRRGPGKKSSLLSLNTLLGNFDEIDYTDVFTGQPTTYKNPHYFTAKELL